MRTTIELSPAHHARLTALAARRGEQGLSAVIAEAVAQYLARLAKGDGARAGALTVRGRLTSEEAVALEARTVARRGTWRCS